MKLLVTVPWEEEKLAGVISAFPQVELCTSSSDAETLAQIEDAEVVLGDFSREVFLAAKQLRWVQCHGAGVNKLVAIPELVAGDVQITSTKGAHAATIAEHFFGLLISLVRQFPKLREAQTRQEWVRWAAWPDVVGRRPVGLQGLTLGIIGFGNIGQAIAARSHAFGMRNIAVDIRPLAKPDYVEELWPLTELPALLSQADAVVVTVPGTPQTAGMLSSAMLTRMKPEAFLIAVSRGGVIDEGALVAMLNDGRLAGAALDVMDPEPPPANSALWATPNLLLTPHCAGKSANTVAAAFEIFRENLARYLAGQSLINLVDRELGF